jgi:hypothetical protein
MTRLPAASVILFLSALLFRLFHFPGGGILLVMSSLLFLWFISWFALRQRKHSADILFASAAVLLTVVIYSRLQLLELPLPVFLLAVLLLLPAIAWLLLRKISFRPLYPKVVILCLLGAWLTFTPTSRIHYFFRLNTVLNAESRKTDYRSWDRYSWYLYAQGHHREALAANARARDALAEAKKADTGTDAYYFTKIVEDHEQQILKHSWNAY